MPVVSQGNLDSGIRPVKRLTQGSRIVEYGPAALIEDPSMNQFLWRGSSKVGDILSPAGITGHFGQGRNCPSESAWKCVLGLCNDWGIICGMCTLPPRAGNFLQNDMTGRRNCPFPNSKRQTACPTSHCFWPPTSLPQFLCKCYFW